MKKDIRFNFNGKEFAFINKGKYLLYNLKTAWDITTAKFDGHIDSERFAELLRLEQLPSVPKLLIEIIVPILVGIIFLYMVGP